jgi:O-antigen ligase
MRRIGNCGKQAGFVSLRTLLTVVLIAALTLIELLNGGTRLVFSLPSYALLGLAGLMTVFRRPERDLKPSGICLLVTIVVFTYILGRAVLSPIPYLWWTDFFSVLGCLCVYFLTVFYVTDNRLRSAVIWALLALAVVAVLIGLRQFSVGDAWMPFGWIRPSGGRRASGFLISSIHLAGYLEVLGLFGMSYALWSRWKTWARILAGYIALMCYVGVVITGSRGGYISAAFSLLVFGAISLYTVRKIRPERFGIVAAGTTAGVIALVVIGAGVMSQSEMIRHRLSLIPQQFEENGLDIRIYNWQAALDQFRVSPVVGTGAGTHVYYGRLFRRPQLQADPIHAHSDYLELLAEYGIIGAIGMAAFLAAHIGRGWRNYRSVLREDLDNLPEWEPARHDSLALYIGALTAISAYAAHSVVDFNLHIPGHALIFAFIFGVLASPIYGVKVEGRRSRTHLIRWILPVLGMWIVLGALAKFPSEYWTERARGAVRDLEFDTAVELAGYALALEEGNPELYFHLGSAHRGAALVAEDQKTRLFHMNAAVEAFQRGIAVFPYDIHMLIRHGQVLDAVGRFKEAEKIYRATIELDRNLSTAHAFYSRHLAIVGRHEEAMDRLKLARERSTGDDLSWVLSGTTLDPRVANQ